MLIAIEGCIAAGKTTTARLVAEGLAWPRLLEDSEVHPFLSDFYADPSRYALETELAFVLLHYHQIHRLDAVDCLVTDFSPVKDLVFGRMNLSGDDLVLFGHVYENMTSRVPKPDLVIYLDVPLDELIRRIRERGRPYEIAIPEAYLRGLAHCYEEHMDQLGGKVQVVHVTPREPPQEVAAMVMAVVTPMISA